MADPEIGGYLDPEDDDLTTSEALQSSIYSSPNPNAMPSPIGQYHTSQYQRTTSSVNNNLIQSSANFSDLQTMSSTDDGNWDETQQYKHDFKSHCERYKLHVGLMIAGVLVFLGLVALIFITMVKNSVPLVILFACLAIIVGVIDGYEMSVFWDSYRKRIPFEFTLPTVSKTAENTSS